MPQSFEEHVLNPFSKKPKRADFEPLTDLIVGGIEDALVSLREKYPDDNFYAFVLSTYGDRSSVSFHANSYENLERIYAESDIVTDPLKIQERYDELQRIFGDNPSKLAKMKQTKAEELAYYKWGWMEWLDYEFIGEQKVLEGSWTWLDDCRKRFSKNDDDWSDAYFNAALEFVPDCMMTAMKRGDAKGLFGTGKARDKCLIYIGEYDGGEDGDIVRTMKHLNPPAALARYKDDIAILTDQF